MKKKYHYTKTNIVRAYSKIAWAYDIWSKLTESKALSRALKFASIEKGESVLEVAVGTGSLFEQLVALNPTGRNDGLDISESMLKRARKRLHKYKNFNLLRGDAYQLPYDNNSFDVLINTYMLDLLPQEGRLSILQEFRRVLKPNGRLVITTMATGRKWYNKIWDVIAKKAPLLLTGCQPVNLKPIIKKAGFTLEKSKYITQNTFPSLVICARK